LRRSGGIPVVTLLYSLRTWQVVTVGIPRCRRCYRIDHREILNRVTLIVTPPIAFILLVVGLISLSPVVLTLAGTACAWIAGVHLWVRRARAREPMDEGWRRSGDYPQVRALTDSYESWQIAKRPWWRGNWSY
jgi:hypothetical protein